VHYINTSKNFNHISKKEDTSRNIIQEDDLSVSLRDSTIIKMDNSKISP